MLLGDELELDVDLAREEHVRVARRLVAEHPDIGAIVLECTNMPPYAADIQRETGRPVFDITSLGRHDRHALAGGRLPRAPPDPGSSAARRALRRPVAGTRAVT